MPKVLRALLISTAATAGAVALLYLMRPPAEAEPEALPRNDAEMVDADRMSDAQREVLVDELASQL